MKGLKKFWILFAGIYVLNIGILTVRAQQALKQEFSKEFSYRDSENSLAKGNLKLGYEILQAPDITHISVNIDVVWFDSQGNEIIDNSGIPYLYLSVYDLSYDPENALSCLSFAEGVNDFLFQKNVFLNFKSNGILSTENITIKYDFRFALSKQDYDLGNLERIIFAGNSKILETRLFIPLQKLITEETNDDQDSTDVVIAQENVENSFRDSIIQAGINEGILKTLRAELANYQNRLKVLKDSIVFYSLGIYISRYEKTLSNTTREEPIGLKDIFNGISGQRAHVSSMINKIQSLQLDIDNFIRTLNNNSNDGADISQIQNPGNQLLIDVNSLKAEYQNHKDDVDQLLKDNKFENLIASNPDESQVYSPDSLLNQFRIDNDSLNNYDLIFLNIRNDYDSLNLISTNIDPVDLSTLRARYDKNYTTYSDFIYNHDSLHRSYLISGLYLDVVSELDSLQNRFKDQLSIVEQKNKYLLGVFQDSGFTNQGLNDSKNVYTWLYILSGIILITFIYFFGRRIVLGMRERKKGPEIGFESWTGGYDPFSLSERNSSKGNEVKLYYPLTWEELNGAYVRFVFLSQSVIKEIYNFSRNSVSRKLVYEVGGYIFGHYERVGVNGIGSYNVFVDQFVPARALESSSHYQMDFGPEALEELERAIQNNQDMVSLGWFHTHPGHSPILSDNNNGIHKKHFFEKWQLAIVIDPTEEGCSSAVYSNKPEGDIVKIGTESSFFRWKDLVGWAENPEKDNVSTYVPVATSQKTYYTTSLNDNWCDSVVSQVSIEKDCIISLEKIIKKKDFRLKNSKIAGFFYGNVHEKEVNRSGGIIKEYDVVIEELIESGPGNIPSKTSGFHIMGWFGFDDCEIFELIEPALEIHKNEFQETWHLAFLLNRTNNELRIFSKRKSMEMNNNVIETNELNFKAMIDWAKAPERSK